MSIFRMGEVFMTLSRGNEKSKGKTKRRPHIAGVNRLRGDAIVLSLCTDLDAQRCLQKIAVDLLRSTTQALCQCDSPSNRRLVHQSGRGRGTLSHCSAQALCSAQQVGHVDDPL